jgi:hypothetical protein
LTREQLEQKQEKRQRTVRYTVVKSYPGSFITVRYGLRTCICIPCSDETRIPVEIDDRVLVTRWERYWLYGEHITSRTKSIETKQRRPRGWFPRCCVHEAFRIEDLWSGKIEPDSDIVRAQFSNFGPEEFDEQDQETPEQHQSNKIPSTSTKKLRQRKRRQEN